MPESHKAEKRRHQKANRAAGIGDADGRIVRVKEAPKISRCTVCSVELKITKTNTEIIAHAENKHGKTIDVCFPAAAGIAAEMRAASLAPKVSAGPSKKERKAKNNASMDDMLSSGLASEKKGKGKGKK